MAMLMDIYNENKEIEQMSKAIDDKEKRDQETPKSERRDLLTEYFYMHRGKR